MLDFNTQRTLLISAVLDGPFEKDFAEVIGPVLVYEANELAGDRAYGDVYPSVIAAAPLCVHVGMVPVEEKVISISTSEIGHCGGPLRWNESEGANLFSPDRSV